MARNRIISGIDIGSSKIVSIIGQVSEEENISIIGVSSVPSRGIRKRVVVDIDKAVEAISESLSAAERMAGCTVASAFVTIGGTHVSCVNSPGVVAVSSPDTGITGGDVARVIEAARAISIPSSREIIHVIPRSYSVDSQEGVQDPIGMSGVRLQIETHIVSGSTTSMRNLVKCVQQVGLDVDDLVFTGLAASESILSETEKELGVVLVAIGGGTTAVVIFTEGSPVFSSVIPIGGKNITNDIAIGLRITLEEAEKVKTHLSNHQMPVLPSKKEGEKDKKRHLSEGDKETSASAEIDISSLNIGKLKSVDKDFLVRGIIRPRLEEVFDLVKEELKRSGYEHSLPSGAVICGGGASTIGLDGVAKKILRAPVRIGSPQGVSGLIEEISSPGYSAAIGMVIFASKRLVTPRISFINRIPLAKLYFEKVAKWAKGLIP
ncbi:cell division protein FtsA [Patescibacteria group bacterium]|nr:cell division protein FtsA [Patescibacteria group bacterium]MBU1868233.1 cell division protein FtsA [Patescibacteria group bacterium]